MKNKKDIVDEVLSLFSEGHSKSEIGRLISKKYGLSISDDAARKRVARIIENHPGLSSKASEVGLPVGDVKSYWYKGKNYSIQVKVPDSDRISIDDMIEKFEYSLSKYHIDLNQYEGDSYELDGDHLLVIDPADVHIGKLSSKEETGEDYSHEMALARMTNGVLKIVSSASQYNIGQILFVGGNDILHVDGPFNSTTSGTRQDVSCMWWESFDVGMMAYTSILKYLRNIAPVHFVHNPSNHDYASGYMLSRVVESWFKDASGFTFDVSMSHRKYYRYGNNLIGTTHGDGAKNDSLPLLMAVEAPDYWSECEHKYIYTHHIHHKTSKDYPGVTIESIRSPSSADSWHHKMGYQHSTKAIEGFVHHREKGQVLRITHKFI